MIDGIPPCPARFSTDDDDDHCLTCGARWHCVRCGRACNMQGSGHETEADCRERFQR